MSVYHPQPKVPCVRCNKNHDTPAAFLMACAKCERAWHHTCHIPQVSEAEILERISFDKQGKRDVGLGGWQCKRCTKRARVEAQTTVNVVGTSAPTSTKPQEHQSKHSSNGPANALAGTTSNVRPQAKPPAPVEIVVIDSDEDDIIVLDHAPEQSQQSLADLKNKAQIKHPPVAADPTVDQQPRIYSKSLSTRQSTSAVGLDNPVKAPKTVKLSKTAQKRPAKSQLIITPLPASREPSTGSRESDLDPSTQSNHIPRPSSPLPPPPPPASEPEDVTSHTRSPTPIRHPQPMQPEPTILHITFPEPPMKTISTADIRALISTMRADGRLAPPPEVEYIHAGRPRDAAPADATPPRSGARKLAYAPGRTPSPELDEVERKLEDFDDDEVEMDVDPRPNPDARMEEEEEEEEDPHNIDDLYGDIAPCYRSQPSRRSKSRSKTAPAPAPAPRRPPPVETRLLSAKRDKRPPKADDLGLLLDRMLWIEERRSEENDAPVRAPRKAAATQRLKRKALRRKQKAGLYFSIHEERKRAAGG